MALAVLLYAVVQPGPEVAGQAAVGAQLSMTEYGADETSWGPGVRALLKVPFTGLALQGTYDAIPWDCGSESCRDREVGFAVLWSLPVHFLVDPYLGVGVAPEVGEGLTLNWDDGRTGVHVLAGLWIGGAESRRTRFFAEVTHLFRDSRLVISAGFLFFLF